MADIIEIATMSADDCAELAAFAAVRCWHIEDPYDHKDNCVKHSEECHKEAKRGLAARARLLAADAVDYALKAWAGEEMVEPHATSEEAHIREFIRTVLSD
jgi:uncharacterized membrane protein YccC